MTPDGPGVERLSVDTHAREVVQLAYGPGAAWLSDRVPRLLGSADDPTGFIAPPQLSEPARTYRNWRAGRTDRVLEALIPAVLEQKVTGKEAWFGWRTLVRKFGSPVPQGDGVPPGLRVFPDPRVWATIPSWDWHAAAVDGKRSSTVLRVTGHAQALEATVDLSPEQANRVLRSLPGIGIWTCAETTQRALGDADAVSYRDYHLAKQMVFALTGDMAGTDEKLAALLLPYAGHRYRVQRLVELGGHGRPRRGPRMTIHDMRAF